MKRSVGPLPAVIMVIGLLFAGSCSEDSDTADMDELGPSVRMLYPIMDTEVPMDVSDSIDVFVAARDDRAVDRLEIWAAIEQSGGAGGEAEPIATLREAIPPGEVPDSLRPGDGSPVYRTRWYTQQITNGTKVRLFSRAYDAAGNNTRSDLVTVRVLNLGTILRPPRPEILVTPAGGTVDDFLTFDASGTEDDIDPPTQITVRWDFENDGIWEHDWAEGLPASAPVQFRYTRAGLYTAVVEARNTYLASQTGRAVRLVQITNVGGDPNPPEPENMIRIPGGTYFVGAPDSAAWRYANANEFPGHNVRIVGDFYIERTEVTNALYLEFLQAALDTTPPLARLEGTLVRYYPDRVDPVESDSLPQPMLDLVQSAIYYDLDADRMAVAPADRDFPVVGVSWYGAKAYAESYGLRLPSEHEWEIAAKGTQSDWIYPWGVTIAADQANYRTGDPSQIATLLPRGSFPLAVSPFGLLDMSGNAKEWVRDWYGPYASGTQTNPEGPLVGSLRVIRGGSYLQTFTGVRVIGREAAEPTATANQIGFRTAYTAP